MQKTFFRDPAASDDQLFVHERNLPRGPSKTDKAEFEPETKGLPKTNGGGEIVRSSVHSMRLVGLCLT